VENISHREKIKKELEEEVQKKLRSMVFDEPRGLVSKETVVLRRWGRETRNFGFNN